MLFELIYKMMIIMININDTLRELNVLNSKESKNSIDKLKNLMRTDQNISKSFNFETIFASFILFIVFTSMTLNKTIESFTKVFKIMYFNNARAITINDVQQIINITLYKQ